MAFKEGIERFWEWFYDASVAKYLEEFSVAFIFILEKYWRYTHFLLFFPSSTSTMFLHEYLIFAEEQRRKEIAEFNNLLQLWFDILE